MKTFGEITPKDYTIQDFYANAPFRWRLVSSSLGTNVVEPDELDTAVTITRGNGDRERFISDSRKINATPVSNENGVAEHLIHSSVKHLFYDYGTFFSGSVPVTSSLSGLSEDIFVVSVGQDFYGERIKPGSFELSLDFLPTSVLDDGVGNLYVSQSGTGSYIGNIFYGDGIAVITHDISSPDAVVGVDGIKIIDGTEVFVNYESEVKIIRHEINVRLRSQDFNFSWFNPSVRNTLTAAGEFAEELQELNIPQVDENEWTIQSLIQQGVIKPYVTTIGLYTDKYELVAVAKLSTPIQRTFDSDQIFIVRFDV
jgi:hypothetical protein